MTSIAAGRTAAVVGCGDVARVHFAALAAMAEVTLIGVCDTDRGRREAAAAEFGVPGFSDHSELLAQLHPDVIHVCVPHDQHMPIAVDALDAGISVILEKPLAESRASGVRIVEAARRSTAKIGICFQNRYNAPIVAAHELLRSGAVGRALGASGTVIWHRTAQYYDDRPWRGTWAAAGGGLLMNQAIHTLDLLGWLLGDVVRVDGGVANRFLGSAIETEDTGDLVLEHQGGARSVFYATLAHVANNAVTLDIVAEKATLSIRGDLTVTYDDGRVETIGERGAVQGDRSYWGTSHELLIHDFYRQLDDARPFWISPDEAYKTLDIIQQVYDHSFPDRLARPVSSEDLLLRGPQQPRTDEEN